MSLTGIMMVHTPFLPGPEDEAFLLPHLPFFAPFRGPQNDGATYIHTYVHTCIHTYLHTNIHTYIHAYVCTYIRMYIHTCIHTYVHTYVQSYNTLVRQCTMLKPRAANTSNANHLTLHQAPSSVPSLPAAATTGAEAERTSSLHSRVTAAPPAH